MPAGNILAKDDLLDFSFEFLEYIASSYRKRIIEALWTFQNKGRLTLKKKKKKKKKNACSIFHAGIYVFPICADYDQNIRVFDSHPTTTELGGNGTGVVVSTKNECTFFICTDNKKTYML